METYKISNDELKILSDLRHKQHASDDLDISYITFSSETKLRLKTHAFINSCRHVLGVGNHHQRLYPLESKFSNMMHQRAAQAAPPKIGVGRNPLETPDTLPEVQT